MTSEEIVQNTKEPTPEHKQDIRESLFEDCPFKLDLKDRYAVDEVKQGKAEYSKLQANKDTSIKFLFNGHSFEVKDPTSYIKSFLEGINLLTEQDKLMREALQRQLQTLIQEQTLTLEYLNQIPAEKLKKLKKEVAHEMLGDYDLWRGEAHNLKDVLLHLQKLQEQIEATTLRLNSSDEKLEENKFLQGCMLHGFAQAAQESNDISTYEKAMSVAEQFAKKKDVEEIFDKRLDKDGKFKITEADLKHIYSSSASTDARFSK